MSFEIKLTDADGRDLGGTWERPKDPGAGRRARAPTPEPECVRFGIRVAKDFLAGGGSIRLHRDTGGAIAITLTGAK